MPILLESLWLSLDRTRDSVDVEGSLVNNQLSYPIPHSTGVTLAKLRNRGIVDVKGSLINNQLSHLIPRSI